MGIKISQLGSKSGSLEDTDLIEIAEKVGISSFYTSKKITGANLMAAIDLQKVTDNGNTTTNDIIVTDGIGLSAIINNSEIKSENSTADSYSSIDNSGVLTLQANTYPSQLKNTNVANTGVILEFPNKPTGSYTIATQEVQFNTQTVAYTLALTDNSKLVEINNAGAVNLTIPPNSSVAFPIGTQILIAQYGAGQITVVPDTGVTLRSSGGKTKTSAQYSMATLIKRGTNEWYLAGDITT